MEVKPENGDTKKHSFVQWYYDALLHAPINSSVHYDSKSKHSADQ
ncbi:MAG: hypothetical protein ACLPLR_09840 [Terriglobales bacterium]